MHVRREGELPGLVRSLLPAAGAFPLGIALTLAVRRLARRRPRLFERLGEYRTATFLIAPSDLAFGFAVVPDGERAEVRTVADDRTADADVTVRGPLLMLLGLLDGTFDGDALFFHRVISVSGRTDALLALRNTLEDADLRPADLLGLKGRPGQIANTGVDEIVELLRRLTGPRATQP